MTSAGRILIMPKGKYDPNVTYEGLDLVFHNGVSWLAKKTVIGVEPSVSNDGYWFKLIESTDLTEVESRLSDLDVSHSTLAAEIASLDSRLDTLEAAALQVADIDLSGYLPVSGGNVAGSLGVNNGTGVFLADSSAAQIQAKKDSNNYRSIKVDNPSQASNKNDWVKLSDCSNGSTNQYRLFGEHNMNLLSSSLGYTVSETGSYVGDGTYSWGVFKTLTSQNGIKPDVVIITSETDSAVFMRPSSVGFASNDLGISNFALQWGDTSVSWYNNRYVQFPGVVTGSGAVRYSLNAKDVPYYYTIIGKKIG